MIRLPRRTFLSGSAAMMGAALAGVRPASAQSAIPMTVGYTGANAFMGAFVAKQAGVFERNGLNVTMQRIPTGSTIPAALVGGSLQVGGLTAPVTLVAIESGLPLRIVAGSSLQSSANPTGSVVARNGSGINSAADFVGRRVGTPGLNGAQHITFMRWLRMNDVDPARVIYVEAAFPQMGDMLRSGQIDATLPVEPFLGRIIDTDVGYNVAFYLGEVAESYIESFWVMTTGFMDANPGAASAYQSSIAEATGMIEADNSIGLRSQVEFLELPEPVAMAQKMPTVTAEVTAEQIAFWIELCTEFGLLRGTLTPEDVLAS